VLVDLSAAQARDVAVTGGKGASLARMIQTLGADGVRVPPGFCLTAAAYWQFVEANGLRAVIAREIAAYHGGRKTLERCGAAIRRAFLRAHIPADTAAAIGRSYRRLRQGGRGTAVAVRSSATAEDLPEASFAGQHDSFLHIVGVDDVIAASRRCFASLFNDRAIAYREQNRIDHLRVALCVCIQRMIRSDTAAAGVMFTTDTETGFPGIVRIEGAWGLGEGVVQGSVNPDSFAVFKPLLDRRGVVPIVERQRGAKATRVVYRGTSGVRRATVPRTLRERYALSDAELLRLARWATTIESRFGCPMDIEWAKDGPKGALYIVQARPETVNVRRGAGTLTTFRLAAKGPLLVEGTAVGEGVAVGPVRHLLHPGDAAAFPKGGILVATETDPDWVPVMRRAAAIVTERGGRTSHAAIVSREFGIPAVIGAAHATRRLRDRAPVTVSCAEGETGRVYAGAARVVSETVDVTRLPPTRTAVMLNMANPSAALRWWRLPAAGVGLARMEFIVAEQIRVHPMALVHYRRLPAAAKRRIDAATAGYRDKSEYFIERLALGIAQIAAPHHPNPVIVRFSDFKTNEYRKLIGGEQFEPREENPMIGWRGASRYYSPDYRDGFALECRAIQRVREIIGLDNVVVMIPFCRTPEEADRVLAEMARHGLKRGRNGLQVYVMCEIPSNVVLADAFADRFDGFSIGSNDLTQLTLGVDRDSERLAALFSERDAAVKTLIRQVIATARRRKRKIGLCGQAPSDHPEYARFLVEAGIDSISVTPDSFVRVKTAVARAEARRR
jgi:pyruvate,water dikinase